MAATEPPPRKPKHLIDFDAPRERRDPAVVKAEMERLQRVQKWVLSSLTATTVLHLAVGVVVAALFLDTGVAEQLVLCGISGAFGIIAVALARGIHQIPILSPWLLLGLTPGIVGAWLVLS